MSTMLLNKAVLSLKGKRYLEAEQMYESLLETDFSQEGWIGMGTTKLYQLADGRTVDEAVFCFTKAKETKGKSKDEIDKLFIKNCTIVVDAFLEFLLKSFDAMDKQRNKAILGTVLAGVSMLRGGRDSSVGLQINSTIGMAVGAGVAVDGFSKINDIKEIQLVISKYLDELRDNVIETTNNELSEQKEFLDKVKNYIIIILNRKNQYDNKFSGVKNFVFGSKEFWIIFLIGQFGGHKFLEKDYKMGFLYLFTIGGFGILYLKDLVLVSIGRYKPRELPPAK